MKYPFRSSIVFLLMIASVRADVSLPAIFGDHMVLQQGVPVPIWGKADAGERVVVSFAGQQADATADADGKWSLRLGPLEATGSGPAFEMQIAGKNNLVFKDVLVGEVWVCSGQSNMEASRRNMVSKEVADARQIRFFFVQHAANIVPQDDLPGKWVVCDLNPSFENPCSGVGYYFSVAIQKSRNVPVGMIQTAWGGTSIQPWISETAYEGSEDFKKLAVQIQGQRERLPEWMAKYEKETLPEWEAKHEAWQKQKDQKADAAESQADKAKPEPEPKRPPEPGTSRDNPSALFHAMVHPLIPYAIRGVVWYQGESNTQTEERSKEYEALMPLLIQGWREAWGQGDFPYLYVQLPALTTDRAWARLRQSQLKALSVPNTGMAVALDLNPTDNLHPPDKTAVGERLALLARKQVYGEELVASGPMYKSMAVEGGKIRLAFTELGGGLVLGAPPEAYRRKDEDPELARQLMGFEVAGSDGVFVPAQAQIDGETVLVWSDSVSQPAHARYAWAAHPKANLYNAEGLPASPFRTDE